MKRMSRAKFDEMMLKKDENGNLKITVDAQYKKYIDSLSIQFTPEVDENVRCYESIDGKYCMEITRESDRYIDYDED